MISEACQITIDRNFRKLLCLFYPSVIFISRPFTYKTSPKTNPKACHKTSYENVPANSSG